MDHVALSSAPPPAVARSAAHGHPTAPHPAGTRSSQRYRSALNDLDAVEYDALALDTMLIHDSTNPPFLPTDLWVVLRDTFGREAGVALGTGHDVDPPFTQDNPIGPSTLGPRHQVETHTLPLASFQAVNASLDLQHLDRVELRTAIVPAGDVVLDNLELRRW